MSGKEDLPTVGHLIDAVRAHDIKTVTTMVSARPELVRFDLAEYDEHRALHYAVLERQPDMVRLLMRHGADARQGIWPHRDATSPITIAAERGYAEIVEVIREEEARRSTTSQELSTPSPSAPENRQLTRAVASNQPEILRELLEGGMDPDERERLDGLEEVVWSWGGPLRECARRGYVALAEMLLARGANPNTNVYAATSAMHEALRRGNSEMVGLLTNYGGIVNATTAANLGLIDRVRELFDDEQAGRLSSDALQGWESLAYGVLESGLDGGQVDIVRIALDHIDWPTGDPRWQGMLMRPFGRHDPSQRERHIACFQMILDRSGVDIPWRFGRTTLHDLAADWPHPPMQPEDRLAFATVLLDKGARLDTRDDLLKSTPLGWACRWGRLELVTLFLERGADPVEADTEPWATPRAWAEKMQHGDVIAVLQARLGGS